MNKQELKELVIEQDIPRSLKAILLVTIEKTSDEECEVLEGSLVEVLGET